MEVVVIVVVVAVVIVVVVVVVAVVIVVVVVAAAVVVVLTHQRYFPRAVPLNVKHESQYNAHEVRSNAAVRLDVHCVTIIVFLEGAKQKQTRKKCKFWRTVLLWQLFDIG